MRIGLVRHFKVVDDTKGLWMTSQQFDRWVEHYEQCDIAIHDNIERAKWDCCYSSDQQRAVKTAVHFYDGEIVKTALLREVNIRSITTTRLKLHRSVWLVVGRIGWLLNHSTQEEKKMTLLRAKEIIDEIESTPYSNVLVTSHGAFMTVLRRELRRRGYKGKYFFKPKNGKLYLFEK